MVANAVRLCRADTGLLLRREADGYRVAAEQGMGQPLVDYLAARGLAPGRDTASGRALLERRVVRLADNAAEPGYDPAVLTVSANRSLLAVPLLRDGEPVGVITVGRERVEPFDDRLVDLVQTFADQAVIAIENARLFQELQDRQCELEERNTTLQETLEQQTGMADVLRIISQAPTDLGAVLAAILEAAVRLCDAADGNIHRVEGDQLLIEAYHTAPGVVPVVPEQGTVITSQLRGDRRQPPPRPLSTRSVWARAVREGRVVHVQDITSDEGADYDPEFIERDRRQDTRTLLAAPMLRDGRAIGVVLVRRRGASRPFTDREIALVETFTDQAVIAIENARLFRELEERNQALQEALEQQTATADVLQVIASSPTDLPKVLDAIAATAARLFGCRNARIRLAEDGHLRIVADHGDERVGAPAVGDREPLDPGDFNGRAVLEGRPIHLPDSEALAEYEDEFPVTAAQTRRLAALSPGPDWRISRLAVPLLLRGEPIGVITVRRSYEVGPFTATADHAHRVLRRPGRHRPRERPAVPGAPGATGAADGHGGGAGGHQPGAHRPAAGAGHDRHQRRAALRRAECHHSPSGGRCVARCGERRVRNASGGRAPAA